MNATQRAETALQSYKSIVYQNQDKKSIFNLYKIDHIKIYKEIVIKYNLNIAETILYFYMASQDEKTWNYNKKELCNSLNWGLTKTKKTIKSLIEKGLIIKIKGIKKYKVIREYSKNFVMIPTEIIKDKSLCDGAKEIYIYMASQSTKEGKVRIYSITDIAKELNRDRKKIIKDIQSLRCQKWIESNEKRNRNNGTYRVDTYKVIYFRGYENETYKEYKTRINQDQNSTSPSTDLRPKPSTDLRPKPSTDLRPHNYIDYNYINLNYKNINSCCYITSNIASESENENATTTKVDEINQEQKARADKRAKQILKECQTINERARKTFNVKNIDKIITPNNTLLKTSEANELNQELQELIKKPVYDFEQCIIKAREYITNHIDNDFILRDYAIKLIELLKYGEGKNIYREPTEEQRAEQQARAEQKQKDIANQEAREKAEKEKEQKEYQNKLKKYNLTEDEFRALTNKAVKLKCTRATNKTHQECFEIVLAEHKQREKINLKIAENINQKNKQEILKFIKQ